MAVVVPFEPHERQSIERLVKLVAPDMERVNGCILSRTGSDVAMIPEVANHLIASGGKRLRPMLTVAMAQLAGYSGDGHIKLAAAVEFMHTATLLHDDVVDESDMRRGKLAARMLWCNEASVLVGDFARPGVQDDGRGRLAARSCIGRGGGDRRGEVMQLRRRRTPPPPRMSISPSSAPRPPSCSPPPAKSGPSSPAARRPNRRHAVHLE